MTASPRPGAPQQPGAPAAPGRASRCDLHHDFPELLSPREPLERPPRFVEREHSIDDRPQLTGGEQAHNRFVLGGVAHRRAEDAPLIPEHPAQVETDLRTRRRPAGHEAAASPQAPQRLVPRRLDRKSTRLNSSHRTISYAVFCLKKKRTKIAKACL